MNLALPNSAGRLEAIARDVESVDSTVPILCGMAANRLWALLGVTVSELPRIADHHRTIARLLDSVAEQLSGLAPDPGVGEVLSLVRAARRHLEP